MVSLRILKNSDGIPSIPGDLLFFNWIVHSDISSSLKFWFIISDTTQSLPVPVHILASYSARNLIALFSYCVLKSFFLAWITQFKKMIIKRDIIRLHTICELTAYFFNQFPHSSSVIEISMFDVCNTSPAKRSLFAGFVISTGLALFLPVRFNIYPFPRVYGYGSLSRHSWSYQGTRFLGLGHFTVSVTSVRSHAWAIYLSNEVATSLGFERPARSSIKAWIKGAE